MQTLHNFHPTTEFPFVVVEVVHVEVGGVGPGSGDYGHAPSTAPERHD